MNRYHSYIFILLALLLSDAAYSQDKGRMIDGAEVAIEASATASSGDMAPMWLSSNRYGLVSPYANSAYERIALMRQTKADSLRQWRLGYGIDLQLNQNGMSTLMLHQAYADVEWKSLRLSVGQREEPMMLKNNLLSSGAQTLGINAMPIPQARLSIDDYITLPIGGRWLGVKGHIAYGFYTDARWQKDFTHKATKYVEKQLYHSKAGYLRIHKPESPLNIVLGLEMANQYAGRSINPEVPDGEGNPLVVEGQGGLMGMLHAFIPSGGDAGEGTYSNAAGNTLGSWVARVSYDFNNFTASIYADKFFEDHSAMFHIDYNGYGEGGNWDKMKKNKWIIYDPKDILLGAEINFKKAGWIDNIVVEYIHTKYQSGPINHDRTPQLSDHIAGKDNYYNHHIYTGWQNWGMVCGNPFFLSPVYNTNGNTEISNSRFVGWHLGIDGSPANHLSYRILASWQRSWGNYYTPYPDPREGLSMLGEVRYSDFCVLGTDNWSVKAAIGLDKGKLRGDTFGGQITISKRIKL